MKASSAGARPEHSFAPVIGSTGCVGHLIWTARGVRAFDADDKEVGTFASMDSAAAALFALVTELPPELPPDCLGWGETIWDRPSRGGH